MGEDDYHELLRSTAGNVSPPLESGTAVSQRKRAASTETLVTCVGKGYGGDTTSSGSIAVAAAAQAKSTTVPVEVLDTIAEFLDGNSLLSCETVSYRWRLATDRTRLWKRACLAAFPHLGDYYLESAYTCCGAYEGDWRETFLDGNRENRSAVLDWNMEAIGQEGGDLDETERRFFTPFSLCGYSFSLLADPGGNPRAASQAQAAGAARIEKGLSVYLTVALQEDMPDAPPWGGVGVAANHPYPPPPLQVGPGHPWADGNDWKKQTAGDGVEKDSEDGQDWSCWDGVKKKSATEGETCGVVGVDARAGATGSAATVVAGAGATATALTVRKDPHGLRRRRRRYRRREGRVAGFSHSDDPGATARECCAAFSLTAVNKTGGKDVMWVSSMEGDRFFPGRSSWGVHCLLPTSIIQDPEEGFLKDGSLTVRLRVRLLFLIAHVYTTADLASHRGFGVVPVRGSDQPFHYYGGVEEETQVSRGTGGKFGEQKPVGPLSCLTLEVLRCTTLAEMEALVARALHLASPQDIRLWVITQPLTDGPLAPRQLLSGEEVPVRLVDDGQDSPSLFRLLKGDTVDDTCRVRLWAEQRGDAGFWETETRHPRWQMPIKLADGTSRSAPRPSSKEVFAGVRLACTAGMPPWLLQSPLAWGTASYPSEWMNDVVGEAANLQAAEQANHGAAAAAAAAAAATVATAAGVDAAGVEAAGAEPVGVGEDKAGGAASGTEDARAEVPRAEERILVFIKTLGLTTGAGKSGREGVGVGVEAPAYLTHAVLRGTSPLRCLFELTADILRDGTAPDDLLAYVEELPCAWQGDPDRSSDTETSPREASRSCSCRSRSQPDGRCPPTSGGICARSPIPMSVSSKPRRTVARRRFFTCPLHAAAVSSETGDSLLVTNSGQKANTTGASVGVESKSDTRGSGGALASHGRSCTLANEPNCLVHGRFSGPDRNAGGSDSRSGEGAVRSKMMSSQGLAGASTEGTDLAVKSKQRDSRASQSWLTLQEAGICSGASICFVRAGREESGQAAGEGQALARRTYAGIAHDLVEGLRVMLRGEGSLGRVHLIRLPEVVEICESLGYQGFRARIAHDQQRHVNARETLEYVAHGRHLAFICDSCGTQDFSGPRYHCLRCPDYDLCEACHAKLEPAPCHRYLFTEGHWKREGGFHGHSDDHELEEIMTVPAESCDWRRRHR